MTPVPLPADPPACQDLRRALAALEIAERRGEPGPLAQRLADLARCYRAVDALPSAEALLAQALRWAHAAGAIDLVADLHGEAAETAAALAACLANPALPADAEMANRRRAARERARDHAFEAARRAPAVSDPQWEVQLLLRLSDVLDGCGDHDDAEALQLRAFRRSLGSAPAQMDVHRLPATGRRSDG